MRRRALLASGGALLGATFAGCLGARDESETTTGEPTTTGKFTTTYAGTDDDLAETTDESDASLSVELERLQPGVLIMGIDSVGVRSAGSQYLYYHVDVTDGDPPARTDFGFRYGGEVYSPLQDPGSGATLWRRSETDDPYYASHRGSGWLLFELPADRHSSHAAFTHGSQEWPVPDAIRERLSADEPPLSVEWGLADDQPQDATRLSFAVTNEGNVETWFVAGLNGINIPVAHRPVAGFHREISAGETVSWTFTDEDTDAVAASDTDEADGHYHLDWTQGEDDLYVATARGE